MKLLSLFSGIGAFEKAFDRLGIPYELVNYCEIDKYASRSYSLVHNIPESKNLGDITKVDTSKLPNDIDLVTYGFPCQDISLAGNQKGLFNEDGTKTRSGLFFEALRIIEDTKPKYAIAENVKNLISKTFNTQFQIVLQSLENAGYNNYYQVLNAKNYGIPQNRERVFIVSIRKDIDPGSFRFPEPFELTTKLKDLLEEHVDEKYYLSQKMIKCFLSDGTGNYPRKDRFLQNINRENQDIGNSVTTLAGNRPTDNFVIENEDGTLLKEKLCDEMIEKGLVKEGDVINHSYSQSRMNKPAIANNENPDCSPTLTTRADTLGVCVKDTLPIKNATKQGYLLAEEGDGVDISSRMQYHRGTVQKGMTQTITTAGGNNVGVVVADTKLRIRKLTPKECWRLMGFDDEDHDKAAKETSNAQLYKQAGNSIVVNVLEELLKALLNQKEQPKQQCQNMSIFDYMPPLRKYKVHIKEILARTVEIEADSIEDAIDKISDKWRDCRITLTADDFSEAEIQAEGDNESTGWRMLY